MVPYKLCLGIFDEQLWNSNSLSTDNHKFAIMP